MIRHSSIDKVLEGTDEDRSLRAAPVGAFAQSRQSKRRPANVATSMRR